VPARGAGRPRGPAACGTLPPNPQFKASKSPLDVVRNSDGTFTSSYTVTVTNTSLAASPVVADLTDTPQMPTGTRLSKVKVREKGVDAQGVTLPGSYLTTTGLALPVLHPDHLVLLRVSAVD